MSPTARIPLQRAVEISVPLVLAGDGGKHQDWQRTVTLAEDYYTPLITGEKMEHLYRRFNRRESEEDLKENIRICQQISPAICNAIANPLRKLPWVKPVLQMIAYDGEAGKNKADELKQEIEQFNGGRDLDSYLASLLDPGLKDPNAFVLLTFENFDNRYEKADVFPTIQPARDVWNFEYHNADLQWLLLHKAIQYATEAPSVDPLTKKPKKVTMAGGDKFILYTDQHHIVFSQVRKELAPTGAPREVIVDAQGKVVTIAGDKGVTFDTEPYYLITEGEKVFEVRFYDQKSGRVPAYRLGFLPDQTTDGRTCVSFLHPALPYLVKSVKSVRELDLSMALHVFPQKLEYRRRCSGNGCNGGQLPDATTCQSCKGSGYETIVTAADHITLPMPSRVDDILDLSKLTHYVQLPEGTLKILIDYVQSIYESAIKAVYNSDVFVRSKTDQTATGWMLTYESIYDTLRQPADWYSFAWTQSVYIEAGYTDRLEGLKVGHKFPRKLNFESTDYLLNTLKLAGEGGAPQSFMQAIGIDLIDHVYVDDPISAQRQKTMARFDPFAGKTEATVLSLIAQGGKTIKRNEVLWTNMPYVFDMAEAENPGFYDLNDKRQREIIESIVKGLIAEMDDQKEQAMANMRAVTGTDFQDDPTGSSAGDPNADAQDQQPQDQAQAA